MSEDRTTETSRDESGISERDIAVIGLAGRFPGAADLAALWKNLEAGHEAVRTLSDEELLAAGVDAELISRPGYVKAASHLEGVARFDAEFFGYSAHEAALLDPQQRLFLEHCWSALEDAATVPGSYEGLIGVYAGVAWNTYLLSNLMTHRELFEGSGAFQLFIANDKDFLPTRVSYKLNLKGPSILVQTSCSTSLVATHLACLGLLSYECDVALVGGVTVKVPSPVGYLHEDGGLASPDGHCRPFDAQAAGTIFGSGVGVVVLKRLAEAVADGDRIRAVIKGSAINNDGAAKVSYTAPSVEGQAEVIAAAQEMAEIDPETIDYVECHGTGTSLGDPIEVRALTKAFRRSTDARGFCALGSIKSNFGHLDAAAGVAGLIKTILALEHGVIPPSLHFEDPNPALDLATSPFYVASEARAWQRTSGRPRRAGVSSFGVGGTNAHLVIEEAPPRQPSGPSRPWQLLQLSARDELALEAASEELRDWLDDATHDELALADLAYTLRVGRSSFRHRRVVVARAGGEASAILAGHHPERWHTGVDYDEPRERPLAFLFPGQGAQHAGMGRGLYTEEKVFRQVVDRCAGELEGELELDLRQLLWPEVGAEVGAEVCSELSTEPDPRLDNTRYAQPALLMVELALAALWRDRGVEPRALLGHSLGEFAAAVVAGVMDERDALRLVALRGRLMAQLPAGAMVGVPLAVEELAPWLERFEGLAVAALNEPQRSVISGPSKRVAAFEAGLAEEGVEFRRLQTSHAFHSTMMAPVAEPLVAALATVRLAPPEIPFLSNVTGTWITDAEAVDPDYWGRRHLLSPVRFEAALAELLKEPERLFLEVGPGRNLTTLARRHPSRRAEQAVVASLRHPNEAAVDGGEDGARMLAALGQLWIAGAAIAPGRLHRGERRHRLSLPTYPFQRQRYWIDAAESPARATDGSPLGRDAESLKRSDPAEWFYLPSWRPALLPPFDETVLPATWLVLALPGRAGRAIVERLRALGRRSVLVEPGRAKCGRQRLGSDHWRLDATSRTEFRGLLDELGEEGAEPGVVIHAWALRGDLDAPPLTDPAAFDRAQGDGVRSLLAWLQALIEPGAGVRQSWPRLLVLADGVEQVTANERLRPEKSPLLGLCRVIPRELPELRCRVLDLSPPVASSGSDADWAGRVLAEALYDDEAGLVAYRGGARWVEAFEPVRLQALAVGGEASVPPSLRQNGVYLLTGGLEGNGYAVARWLATTCSARLVLVHPQPLTAKDQERLATLSAAGGEAMPLQVAPGDLAAWSAALSRVVRCHGTIHGLFHTASPQGEETFRTLGEIDADHLADHFRPRVHDALALAWALESLHGEGALGDGPDFCLLLSSLASTLGGVAYGAYAAASRFLDAFARDQRKHGSLPWRAVAWDVWRLDGEERQITELRADLAALAMTPSEGEEALVRLLAHDAPLILVSTGDLQARRARGAAQQAASHSAGSRHARPRLPVTYAPPESELEERIATIWSEFLGFEEIGLDDNFFDLGGDSFIAVRVAARLNQELESSVPVAQIYQGLTVRSLAELLGRDEESTARERGQHLSERRASVGRRQELLLRRRDRKNVEVHR